MRRAVAAMLAALLVAPSFASASDDDDATRRTKWLATRDAIAEQLGVRERASTTDDWAYLANAGDLDGDRANDVVDIRTHIVDDDVSGYRETVRLEAFRGRDGKALWTLALPEAAFVFAVPANVGLDGKPGFVVLSYSDNDVDAVAAGGDAGVDSITAYDGGGKQLWVAALPTGYADAPAGAVSAYTNFNSFVDAIAGGGPDLLVRTTGYGYVIAGVDEQTASQFHVVDSATGVLRPLGTPFPQYATGAEAGDLDRDGVEDVVVTHGDALTALRGKDGTTLWTLPDYGVRDSFSRSERLGADVTGDGVTDVAVNATSFSSRTFKREVVIVDGAKGKVTARFRGSFAEPMGNVDGKPGSELLVAGPGAGAGSLTAAAYTGTGRRVWSVSKTAGSGGDVMGTMTSYGRIGDVQPDGVLDLAYAVETMARNGRATRREGLIDGRTGRDRALPGNELSMARDGLDGRGADFYDVSIERGSLTVSTWSGTTRRKLWTSGVAGSGFMRWGEELVSVDGDKCGDLAVSTASGATTTDVVFAGSTGKPLWSLRRSGNAPGQVTKPAARSNRVFTRSC